MAISKRKKASYLALLGLLYGLIIGLLSLLMSGAGHGWNSAFGSILCVFYLPLLGYCWVYKNNRIVSYFLAYIVIGALFTDIILLYETSKEGFYFVGKVLSVSPSIIILWILLWLFWHLVLVILIRKVYKNRRSEI
ncbi:MAG: hypothetical protein OEY18_06655 [Candidatus Aminicenantes bacterium]|nr:hypothetical protein [Candidatus Aminicenantes bacterium]MDH5744018.1 hypothetical protein [Candidatus Aminicenantes bacterium]